MGSASACSNTTHPSSQGESLRRLNELPTELIHYRYFIYLHSHCSGVELHLEFFQIQPVFGLAGVQVMVEIPSSIAEAVELPVRSQEDGGWSLLIGHTGVSAFPTPRNRQVSY